MTKYEYRGTGYAKWDDTRTQYRSEFLIRLFRDMLRIRLIEEEIERHYHQDQMKTPIHLLIGQQATSVSVRCE